jgi:hypothetical protein
MRTRRVSIRAVPPLCEIALFGGVVMFLSPVSTLMLLLQSCQLVDLEQFHQVLGVKMT